VELARHGAAAATRRFEGDAQNISTGRAADEINWHRQLAAPVHHDRFAVQASQHTPPGVPLVRIAV
jgi:hypothetical protein